MSVCACGAYDDGSHTPECGAYLLVGCFCCKARLIVARKPLQHDAALLDNLEERGAGVAGILEGLCTRHHAETIASLVAALVVSAKRAARD